VTIASKTFIVTINEKVHEIVNDATRSLEGDGEWCSRRC
jgi:hypothetical protein